MSDNRSISGNVSVKSIDGVPRVALEMAMQLWWEEHQKQPKMSEGAFFTLVQDCARALSPNYAYTRIKS